MKLTYKEIEYGYWTRSLNKPIDLTVDSKQIYKVKDLGLDIPELNRPKILKQWIKVLPNLAQIENLWTYHKLNQEMFEIICELPNIKGLNIKWSGLKSIDSIVKLDSLKHLYIGSSTSVENIRVLPQLLKLETLSIENFKSVSDFGPISNMTNLIGLGLNGGMYSTLKIDSLEPVGHLTNLKHLQLINTTIKDKSIKPILNLKELECLRLTYKWTENDFELLRANLPRLKYGNVVPDKNANVFSKIFFKKK
jgi:hypothetical protein